MRGGDEATRRRGDEAGMRGGDEAHAIFGLECVNVSSHLSPVT